MTLGSLFDGSRGFPLGGIISGITPVWAAEIEPFPIRVTTRRIPQMKHYGDVRKMDGSKIEPVDIITFGSPCQDLSAAGKHNGLEGSRSSLFHEAVRIIKEMRKATDGKYPRYAVWENVPGALSSNEGEDFRIVLETLCAIKRPVLIPRPRRWTLAGEIMGNGLSVAWRTFDAQFWGVPQRRRRIFLIADFREERAREILFERRGVCGRTEESRRAWKNLTRRVEDGFGITGIGLDSHSQDSRIAIIKNGKISTLTGNMGTGGNNGPLVMTAAYGFGRESDPAARCESQPSITARGAGMVYDGRMAVRRLTPLECCRLQGFPDWWCDDLGTENPTADEMKFWHGVFRTAEKKKSDAQLRKWLKNPRSDMAEYKMWGNGVALPCVTFILWRIANVSRLQSQNEAQRI